VSGVLTSQDDNAAVLSYDFWQQRFAGSPSILGRSIRLNGRALTVVGVLPKGLNGLTVETSPDVRIPISTGRSLVQEGNQPFFQVFGMLRPGVTLERAQAEIEPRLRRVYDEALAKRYPGFVRGALGSRLNLEAAGHGVSTLRQQLSRGLILLMAAVGMLLFISNRSGATPRHRCGYRHSGSGFRYRGQRLDSAFVRHVSRYMGCGADPRRIASWKPHSDYASAGPKHSIGGASRGLRAAAHRFEFVSEDV
jgi:hypothetical protein